MGKRCYTNRKEVTHDYFLWLCEIIDADDPDYGYLRLMEILFDTEFTDETAILIKNDCNRVEDGLALRRDYAEESLEDTDMVLSYLDFPCSLLEMLVALSLRIENDLGYETAPYWFWEMMRNLGLSTFTDNELYDENIGMAKRIIEDFLLRRYDKNGNGGLFPSQKVSQNCSEMSQNQRKVEIWYQMNAYLINFYM